MGCELSRRHCRQYSESSPYPKLVLFGELIGAEQEIALARCADGKTQSAVIVVVQGDKTEGLETALIRDSPGVQHLCHAMHRTGLRMKCDLDEVAFLEGATQLQKTAGDGDSLQLGAALAVLILDQGEG